MCGCIKVTYISHELKQNYARVTSSFSADGHCHEDQLVNFAEKVIKHDIPYEESYTEEQRRIKESFEYVQFY